MMGDPSYEPGFHAEDYISPLVSRDSSGNPTLLGPPRPAGLGDNDLNLWAANRLQEAAWQIEKTKQFWISRFEEYGIGDVMIELYDKELARFDKAIKILRNA